MGRCFVWNHEMEIKERMGIDHGMTRAIGLKIVGNMANGVDGERD